MGRWVAGSSPLARGLRHASRLGPAVRRIIPARAGFTQDRDGVYGGDADHPRSRGVYPPGVPMMMARRGSSPLARGLPILTEPECDARQDHPRSRGVYSRLYDSYGTEEGSSPLARGLHVFAQLRVPWAGIIPARAGFTHQPALEGDLCQDHPRSRGVYKALTARFRGFFGSSPLARGLRSELSGSGQARRIIPARAGFTRGRTLIGAGPADHPRSRGVYSWRRPSPTTAGGSSPLARGLPLQPIADGNRAGIIPARAGFTSSSMRAPLRRGSSPLARGLRIPSQDDLTK